MNNDGLTVIYGWIAFNLLWYSVTHNMKDIFILNLTAAAFLSCTPQRIPTDTKIPPLEQVVSADKKSGVQKMPLKMIPYTASVVRTRG